MSSEAAGPRHIRPVLVSVQELDVRYGSTVACDRVELDIRRGEVVGLVGESGSGKTSLGRALLGLAPISGGQITIDSQVLPARIGQRPRAMLPRLQMVFQSPDSTLNPRHRVRQILQRSVDKLNGPRSVAELAEAVQLSPEHLDTYPGSLSGGQKQRVAIARAFAGRPDLVVCDEPVSALDVSVQAAILSLLATLQAEQDVAYLFVSHDLGVIRYLADRVAVMYRGQLVEVGPVEQIFAPPCHPYTEMLLAAVPSLEHLGERRPVRLTTGGPGGAPEVGCRFADRCPRVVAGLCDTEPPPWQEVSVGHRLRCHLDVGTLSEPVEATPVPAHLVG
jgi:peptide/nickel transport system ATP-binding protein